MKVENWVVDLAEECKKELMNSYSQSAIDSIAHKIRLSKLTKEQMDFIWEYFSCHGYDRKTGCFLRCESDNSEFLKVVDMVKAKVRGNK